MIKTAGPLLPSGWPVLFAADYTRDKIISYEVYENGM
jgi:hypothetical protein